MNMREQRFGIEIELTGITRSSAARAIAGNFGTRSDHVGGGYDAYHVVDGEERTWKVMSDSSLRTEKREDGHKRAASNHYKVEVVSPILRYGDIETLQEIVRALRREGAFANDSCGIHAQDAAHALQHRGQQGGPSLPRPRGWAEPRRATGTRTARRRSAAGGTRRPRSPGSRTGARPGTSTWTTRRGPPPPPRPCAWRCRARTSRPPRRRARGPPGSSALKTEVSH